MGMLNIEIHNSKRKMALLCKITNTVSYTVGRDIKAYYSVTCELAIFRTCRHLCDILHRKSR